MPESNLAAIPRETGLTLQHFIDHSPIAIARLDQDGCVFEANAAFHRLTRSQFHTKPDLPLMQVIDANEKEAFLKLLVAAGNAQSIPLPTYLTLHLESGETVIALTYAISMIPAEGQPSVLILYMTDQTEQKNLELRFAHSQKMQAVGQLAGGVAHDFNNLLTAMIGFCDLLLMRHPAGDPSFADIMQVKQNANRAANLVRQLLAFSRRQTLQPKILDMTDLLAELANLIRRLIGENITLNMTHGRDLGAVKADQGQLEQVIINLAVNARDAMTEGGTLSITTSDVRIERSGPPERGMISPSDDDHIVAGDYVLVRVADTGTGIPAAIVKSVFEPFFSTKEIGSGTGLGLSTVYGIIKQTDGYLYVSTIEGKGTTFSLYFKRYESVTAAAEEPVEDARSSDLTGGETILLVEDETPVRIFAARALRNKGYVVLEADCGENALEVFAAYTGKIDVIITDVMMPGINGPKMIKALEQHHSEAIAGTQIIFISGYAEDAFVDTFGTSREFNFLPKPFTLKQLAAKVKDVITTSVRAEG